MPRHRRPGWWVLSILAVRLGAFHFTPFMEGFVGKVLAYEDRGKHKVYVFKLYWWGQGKSKIMTGWQALNPNKGSEWVECGTRIVPPQKACLLVQLLGQLQVFRQTSSILLWVRLLAPAIHRSGWEVYPGLCCCSPVLGNWLWPADYLFQSTSWSVGKRRYLVRLSKNRGSIFWLRFGES